MNGFYLAKKNLRYSGYLDLVFIVSWSVLFLLISVHHLCVPNAGDFSGYSAFFGTALGDLQFFKPTVWHPVLILFVISLVSFLAKVVLGSISLFWFHKSRNLMLLCAAASVIFLPLVGGIVALNTYHATTSSLAPRYISSFSLLRSKIRALLGDWIGNADNQ